MRCSLGLVVVLPTTAGARLRLIRDLHGLADEWTGSDLAFDDLAVHEAVNMHIWRFGQESGQRQEVCGR